MAVIKDPLVGEQEVQPVAREENAVGSRARTLKDKFVDSMGEAVELQGFRAGMQMAGGNPTDLQGGGNPKGR